MRRLLAVDADGVVVGANTGARSLLNTIATGQKNAPADGLIGKHLTSIFKCGFGDVWNLMKPQTGNDRTILRTLDQRMLFAAATAPRETVRSGKADSQRLPDCPALTRLAGDDSQMTRMLDQARRLVNKRVNILIQGETGTGKEVLARALHDSSTRSMRAVHRGKLCGNP